MEIEENIDAGTESDGRYPPTAIPFSDDDPLWACKCGVDELFWIVALPVYWAGEPHKGGHPPKRPGMRDPYNINFKNLNPIPPGFTTRDLMVEGICCTGLFLTQTSPLTSRQDAQDHAQLVIDGLISTLPVNLSGQVLFGQLWSFCWRMLLARLVRRKGIFEPTVQFDFSNLFVLTYMMALPWYRWRPWRITQQIAKLQEFLHTTFWHRDQMLKWFQCHAKVDVTIVKSESSAFIHFPVSNSKESCDQFLNWWIKRIRIALFHVYARADEIPCNDKTFITEILNTYHKCIRFSYRESVGNSLGEVHGAQPKPVFLAPGGEIPHVLTGSTSGTEEACEALVAQYQAGQITYQQAYNKMYTGA